MMQTFMPYDTFEWSIQCLDNRRLGKQRVEAKQILDILLNRTDKKGWRNHPAVKMWRGHEEALKEYYNICVEEWIIRGYKNTMKYEKIDYENYVPPYWMKDPAFHASHRANLLRKNSEFYGQYGWTESNDLKYVWP